MKMPTLQERFRGALLGLATGDAVGTTVEFKSRGFFALVTDMEGGGPFDLEPGEWTDDTSMALCLAASLIECPGFDAQDQMERYVRWWKEGYMSSNGRCFDIGNTTANALGRFVSTGEPFAGSVDTATAGNGSLMRLAPAPLFYSADATQAIFMAGESSRTTHGAKTAVDACRYFAGLIVAALNGATKDELLSADFSPAKEGWQRQPLEPSIADIAQGSFKTKSEPEIESTGYVAHSLEAALWAFWNTDNFKDGCLMVVNLGEDADTTGAIYGQIAGAYYGVSHIPAAWRRQLAKRKLIENLADQLLEASARGTCR